MWEKDVDVNHIVHFSRIRSLPCSTLAKFLFSNVSFFIENKISFQFTVATLRWDVRKDVRSYHWDQLVSGGLKLSTRSCTHWDSFMNIHDMIGMTTLRYCIGILLKVTSSSCSTHLSSPSASFFCLPLPLFLFFTFLFLLFFYYCNLFFLNFFLFLFRSLLSFRFLTCCCCFCCCLYSFFSLSVFLFSLAFFLFP